MQWTFYQFNSSSSNEKEILQSASDKTSENMSPNSFPFQFCIFEFRKSRFLFLLISFLNKEVKFLRVCKDFSIYPNRKLNITPHRSINPLFSFFKHCLMNSPFKFAHFHFASFLLKSFLNLNNGFLQALASFFLQECPFWKNRFSG